MNRLIITLLMAFTFGGAQAQNSEASVRIQKFSADKSDEISLDKARLAVLNEELDRAIYIYGILIDRQKEERSQGKQVSNEILAEYAYVLALSGAQEAALVNIDLALNLKVPSKTIYFYVGSILGIVGFAEYAEPFREAGKEPQWLDGKGKELNDRYRSPALLSIEKTDETIKHISACTRDSRYIEALCFASCLTHINPSLQAAWLLQSAVFEKLGCFTYAFQSFEKGLGLCGNREMPGMEKQLSYLRKKSEKSGNRLNEWQLGSMVYGGLTYSNKTTSINARYGIYSGPFSVSLNMNVGIPSHGDASYYIGLSSYYNIRKFFTGLGLGLQKSGKSSTFTFSPTVGLSLINKRRTSSFDISIYYSIPCKSGVDSTVGITIGKTFYFNISGKSK